MPAEAEDVFQKRVLAAGTSRANKRDVAKRHPLTGTWRLLSCVHRLDGGKRWYPFGRKPSGRLIYTPDGFMMVQLMAEGRRLAASGQVFEASSTERAGAAAGFLAYSGRCELGKDSVVHHVDLSLFPNWVGSAQLRSFKLVGDRVTFQTRRFSVRGKLQTASLTWKRETISKGRMSRPAAARP